MDISNLFDNLNDKQQAAVTAPRCHLLVLAGAGSGKTRMLVHRIAWLLSVENCSPCSIMAVTFTNKAATEMRYRIKKLIGTSQNGMWVGTFHGLAHRLLRTHYMEANLPHDFQILDTDDQLRLLKRIINTLNVCEQKWPLHQVIWYINNKKDEGLRPQHIKTYNDPVEGTWLRIYQAYHETCERAGLVDFAELLLKAYELWLNKPDILHYYRKRFTNVLIDEFQDTNSIQYAWIRLLASDSNNNVMIVGDDDQSIYGWRGSQVENIQYFLKDFPNATTMRLEQNYRSSGNIIEAANTLISHNDGRMGKKLWTNKGQGAPIVIYRALNELKEALFVINCIKKWHANNGALKDCAILYRSNAQSRLLEEALLSAAIPYHIYGGQRFFERQEIKDALAYLRLILNRNDDAAFERVVNTPTRDIGRHTLNLVRQAARERQITLWQATKELLYEKVMPNRAAYALQCFTELVDSLAYATTNMPLHIQTDLIIQRSGLFTMYQQGKGEKSQVRVENLAELVTATRQYKCQEEDHNLSPLQAFLSHVMLEIGEVKNDHSKDTVQLMTLHSAKGLEFPIVFIIGMEEGIFPSQMSLEKKGRLEEERRLAYVGVTRAMEKLTLTYAETRRLYGKTVYHQPSRFINELPRHCITEIQPCNNVLQPITYSQMRIQRNNKKDTGYKLGQHVRHPKFGTGTIISLEGDNEHLRLQVSFYREGVKWLVAAYARLENI